MKDITIIFLTANMVPKQWGEYQRKVLLEAAGDSQIISVSREPMNFGMNIIDNGKKSTDNIYRQMLRAIKLAKTDYIATAEDDVLYPPEHYSFYRPKPDTFGYNKNRMLLFTWGPPMYHWRNRLSNATLIAPRELAIEALEERFAKWPNGTPERIVGELGRRMVENNQGVTNRKCEEKFSDISVIHFNHETASEERQRKNRKSYGAPRAYDIPHWGHAKDLVKLFR